VVGHSEKEVAELGQGKKAGMKQQGFTQREASGLFGEKEERAKK